MRHVTTRTSKAKKSYTCSGCASHIGKDEVYYRLVLADTSLEDHVICADCQEQLNWLTISDFHDFEELSEYLYQIVLCRMENDMVEAAADAEHERRMFDAHEAEAINKEYAND